MRVSNENQIPKLYNSKPNNITRKRLFSAVPSPDQKPNNLGLAIKTPNQLTNYLDVQTGQERRTKQVLKTRNFRDIEMKIKAVTSPSPIHRKLY